jgi:hypothetical protein
MNQAPLDPNHQVRWAIEHLPSAAGSTEEIARVPAPALGGARTGEPSGEVTVEFRRGAREHRGVQLQGWVFEGPVTIDATDQSVDAGFPGIDAWVIGKLGPYCLHVDVLESSAGSARVRAFAVTRDALDEATEGRG